MRRYKYLLIPLVLALCAVLIAPTTSVRAAYVLTSGNYTGGGGASGSDNNALIGTFGFGPMDYGTSTNYIMNGGLVGTFPTGLVFFAIYNMNQAVDTVAMATRTLTLNYGNNSGAVSGYFFYRYRGAFVFDSAAMYLGAGNTINFELSTGYQNPRGLDYFFKVYDDIGITRTVDFNGEFYSFLWYMTNAQGRRPTAMPEAKYRIVGLPVNPSGLNGVADIFLDDLGNADNTQWRLGRYLASAGEVQEFPPNTLHDVEPGVGYWLAARHSRRYGAEGYSVTPNLTIPEGDFYIMDLDSGWNQVANPFAFPINWDPVRFEDDGALVVGHPSDVLDNAAWWYDGDQFVSVDSIPAWDGFFVNIKKNNIRILFPYWEFSGIIVATQKTSKEIPGNWELGLELSCQDQSYLDACNYIGVRDDARIGGDKYDFAEPPSPPGAPYLALSVPESSGLYSSDYRPQFTDGAEWLLQLSKGEKRVLKVKNLDQLPADMEVWLVFDNNTRRQIISEGGINLNDYVNEARLIVGTRNYVNNEMEELIPRTFALEQNYPNPFNPVTNISFDLPEAGRVHLEVFNILGQNVRTLVDRDMPPGTYLVEWDSRDNGGNAVASGIYFYRITYGDISTTKKMVLLK